MPNLDYMKGWKNMAQIMTEDYSAAKSSEKNSRFIDMRLSMNQKEINKTLAGFDKLMAEEESKFIVPRCHNTPMRFEESDYEVWFECRHCGHTKEIGMLDIPH